MEKDKGKGKKKKDKDDDDTDETMARVIFVVPEGARLHVDGKPVHQDDKAGVRTYTTPSLEQGKRYFYDVRVEVVRDGKPVSEDRRIILRAGSQIRADFSKVGSATGVAAADRR
jgi:uncharacterized protein (TIGR03000 family)